jgi:DNA-binding SARP family transcriptional activator/tetratricopeptide (TPR) repeat protein
VRAQLTLLGQVELRVGATSVDLGPARQRTVFAALALDAGRPVPVETLLDRVWGADVRETTRSGLYSYITRLRRAVAGAGQESAIRLVASAGAYVLAMDVEAVDLHRFRRLVKAAREDPSSCDALGEVLATWRGPALAGLASQWVERVRRLLDQERLDAAMLWAAAGLDRGQGGEMLASLRGLLTEHPLVEPLTARLIEALVQDGRTAEALDCYATTRRRLVDELGTEPGPQLRRLHHRLLTDDIAPAAARPAQLPMAVLGFVGRDRELAELDAMLDPRTSVVAAISGTAGVGKTSLAVHWAHRTADRFPDGQLYANLHGYSPDGRALDPVEVLGTFLAALGVPPGQFPAGIDGRAALFRGQLVGRRLLVLLDNARSADQVRPLLPATPGCLAVVTSRDTLAGLVAVEGARPVMLDLLPARDARQLLAVRLGAGRLEAESVAAEEIIARCARLPLALAVVAARAATRKHLPLATFAAELSEADHGLQTVATDVRTVLSWSYRALSQDAARLFRLLGLHPGPDVTVPAAASLAGVPVPRARQLLAELDHAQLLVEHAAGRYASHDLLRAYAAELASAGEAGDAAARRRMLDYYLHAACAASRSLQPFRHQVLPARPVPGVVAEEPADALGWFGAEYPVLLGVHRLAGRDGADTHCWQLAWALEEFLDRQAYWLYELACGEAAVAAAERLADADAVARSERILARAHSSLGHPEQAIEHLRRALGLFERLADLDGQATCHLNMCLVYSRNERRPEGNAEAERAIDLYRRTGSRRGEALALDSIAFNLSMLGEPLLALERCTEALGIFREVKDPFGEALALDSIGHALHRLGRVREAISHYERAVALFRELGDRINEAESLGRLGEAFRDAGDSAAARNAWQRALDLYIRLDHPDTDRLRANLAQT